MFRKPQIVLISLCFLLLISFFLPRSTLRLWEPHHVQYVQTCDSASVSQDKSVEMVVASLKSDNTNWLEEYFPHWHHKIYVVDDAEARYTIPQNKGREAMVYLSHIIENYNNLAEYILFIHANRWQWHNDDPDYDGYAVLTRLRFHYLREVGYANLRCTWALGCPAEIRLAKLDEHIGETKAVAAAYSEAFEILFPGIEVPQVIGASCCAQFAVTREAIQRRTRDDYIRYRDWLLDTDLSDSTSGRLFEYSWHIIFGKDSVHCPDEKLCYCKLYGLCTLNCEGPRCNSYYTLPPYSVLPSGLPLNGWEGEERVFHGPLPSP